MGQLADMFREKLIKWEEQDRQLQHDLDELAEQTRKLIDEMNHIQHLIDN